MVAVVSEKLVGLTAGFIVDDGKTCIWRAAHVLPEYCGCGISKKLSRVLDEYVRHNFQSVIRVRLVTRYNNFSKNSLTKLKTIHHFEVLSYDIGEEAPHAKEKSQEISTVRIARCTKEYILDIIFSNPAAQQLVLDSILFYDCLPFKLCSSNFEKLLQEFENLEFYIEKCCTNSYPKSFNLGCATPRIDYIHWTMHIYASNECLYQAHLLHQFKRACETIKGRFIFVSSTQSEHLTSDGRMLMEDKLQLRKSDNLQEIKLYVFS